MVLDDLGLAPADRDRLTNLLAQFDEHWSPQSLADTIEDIVQEPDQFAGVAVVELIKVDMQRQWQSGNRRTVEDYHSFLTSVGIGPEIPASLLLAEFLARHSSGDSPSAKDYQQRFPSQFDAFKTLLETEKSRRPDLDQVQATVSTGAGKGAIDTASAMKSYPLDLPRQFGRYEIIKKLGAGAMGAVHLALDTKLERHVALKTPSFANGESDDLIQRFYREARAAANLHHPNICPVFDVGEIDGRHFISMAYIEGRPLSDYISQNKRLQQKTVAGVIRKLALALASAHESGIIHRDLKPANVMVDSKRQPLVMDFGLARRDDEMQSRLTHSGMILGTPAYMSPEQVQGNQEEVGPQADIYSLGVILYEMLTGRLPFTGSMVVVIGQILCEEPTPLLELRSDIDPALVSICNKMMAKDLTVRYPTMKAVSDDLSGYLKGQSPQLGSVTTAPVQSQNEISNRGAPTSSPRIGDIEDPLELQIERPPSSALDSSPTLKPLANAHQHPEPAYRFWRSRRGLLISVLAGSVGLAILCMTIILVLRTPHGTLIISSDDPNITVEIDGDQVTIRDDSPFRFKEGTHELTLKIGDQLLPVGDSLPFEVEGREGEYRLSTKLSDIELLSNNFDIQRGKSQVLSIRLVPHESQVETKQTALPAWIASSSEEPRNNDAIDSSKPIDPVVEPLFPNGPAGEVFQIPGPSRRIYGMSFTSDGRGLVYNSDDKSVAAWNLVEQDLAWKTSFRTKCRNLSVSPAGKLVAISGAGGVAQVLKLNDGSVAHKLHIRVNSGRSIMGIDCSPDGSRVAVSCNDGMARVCDVLSGQLIIEFPIKASHNAGSAIHFTPDGQKLVATAGNRGTIAEVFDASDGSKLAQLRLGSNEAAAPHSDILRDRNHYVTGSWNGSVHIWDLNSYQKVRTVRVAGGGPTGMHVACSPDGRWIACGHPSGNVFILEAENLTTKHKFWHGKGAITKLCFSPDSRFLATASDKHKTDPNDSIDIKIWRVEDSQ